MVRNGKIARLPRPLRDELNRRLSANEDGGALLDWLNAAPDVKDLLARDFAGEPVSKQNLHEWRHGGFLEWQSRQDLFAEAADLTDANGEWDALAANDFTERLAAVLVVRYADALAGWNGGDDEAFRLKLRDLRRFNQDLAVLRRYNQSAARLKMDQMPFYREEQQRAEAAASAKRQSEAGARAYDERVAQRRRNAEAAAAAAAVAASPANGAGKTATDQSVTCAAAVVIETGSPRSGSGSGKELPTRSAADDATAGLQPSDAGKSAGVGAATLAASLNRAKRVVEFADSLRHSLTVIKGKSGPALSLDDRRAVHSAYADSVATLSRLGTEAGLLRAELPGSAEVDRVNLAVEMLQLDYLRMKSNLFQGCPDAVAVGIQQLRNAACELSETLQRKVAPSVSLAVRAA